MTDMEERVLTLAGTIAGEGAEEALLAPLCAAAVRYWEGRLRDGVSLQDCGEAFPCAAAFTAAADTALGRSGGAVASFTAGEVSLHGRGAADSAQLARNLRLTAERLMAPYIRPEDFACKGVRG